MKPTTLFALALLAAPVPAQLTFQGGTFTGLTGPILPFQWGNKPALVVVLPFGGGTFLRYYARISTVHKYIVAPQSWRLVAGWFQDARACAVGAPIYLNIGDHIFVQMLGRMGNGSYTFIDPVGVLIERGEWPYTGATTKPYDINYCVGGGMCHGCNGAFYDQPQFSVLVLVPEG